MKKTLFSIASFLFALGAAQAQWLAEPAEDFNEAAPKSAQIKASLPSESSTAIWSEDFANGIPSSWSQNGSPALVQWEYRGPNTNPSNAVGSRGCFAGPLQNGNLGSPLVSPTDSNGFIIFDSDWYHSDGDRSTNGQGVAPAPHTGRLTTSSIDLSAHPAVELSFYTYLRRFQAAFRIAFSRDGGITFPDTLEIYPVSDLAVNQSSGTGDFVRVNVSNIIGGESNAAMSFIFDGTLSTSSGNAGRYFWMLDDIAISPLPNRVLQFTSAIAPGTSGMAPAMDIIYQGGGRPKYLHLSPSQPQSIAFDANILNYGAETQSNVRLEVTVEDAASNTVVATLSSPAVASLSTLDTGYYTTLTTPSWTPRQPGEYRLIYRAISDSISSATTTAVDSFPLFVGDRMGLDDGIANNYFGTNTGTNGMNAIGVRFDLAAEDSTSAGVGTGKVYLQGVDIEMSALTDSTADVEFVIFDTTGFSFGSSGGFPASSLPLYNKIVPLNSSLIGGLVNFSFEDNNNQALALDPGSYYLVMIFYPNANDGVVRIANSTNWGQPSLASIFQNFNGAWFNGFSNSVTYVAPHMRLVLAGAPNISLAEEDLLDFQVYPNPTSGRGSIDFGEGGAYQLQLTDLKGQVLWGDSQTINAGEQWRFDFGQVPKGLYLLHLDGPRGRRSVKLSLRP